MEHIISDIGNTNIDNIKVNSITDNAAKQNEHESNNFNTIDDETNMHSSVPSSSSSSLSSILSSTLRTVEKALLTSNIKHTYATMQKDDNTTVNINTEMEESYDNTINSNKGNNVDSNSTTFG